MLDHRSLGQLPRRPHTVFKNDGEMVAEHVFTRDGFSDLYSILYQKRAPTHETSVEMLTPPNPYLLAEPAPPQKLLKRRHVQSQNIPFAAEYLAGRQTLFINDDCSVGVAKFNGPSKDFFSNGDSDELHFVVQGQGVCQTIFGELDYKYGDYIYIPKSVPYRFIPKGGDQVLMVTEGNKGLGIPSEFRLAQGQLKLDAPYGHRDFKSPQRLLDVSGENPSITIKRFNALTQHTYTEWPYDVVGWDGWVYPFTFDVKDYRPRTTTLHLPPTSHTIFAGENFVVMNFVPRKVDYAEGAIPCPYPHSSVDCDEVLFYVEGNFTSRKGISSQSLSFHPGGIPHGPHPGKYEASVGDEKTDELAIMVDTIAPLTLTKASLENEDDSYHDSWNTKEHL